MAARKPTAKNGAAILRGYHEDTKYSYRSVRAEPHSLDWANQPMPFKVYTRPDPIELPSDPPRAEAPLFGAPEGRTPGRWEGAPSVGVLARLFFLSAGITKRLTSGGRPHYFRAAACTGALYHIELYLVCADLRGGGGSGLPAGVYHLAVHDYAARSLREGDFRGVISDATGSGGAAPAALVLTSTFWRNAWKYRARAYRHGFWDSGTILANLLAAAEVFGLPARVALGFADGQVNDLLGLNPEEEASLAVVLLGEENSPPPAPPSLPRIRLETMPLSAKRVDYPAIRTAHAASELSSGSEAAAWRAAVSRHSAFRAEIPPAPGKEKGDFYPLAEGENLPADSVDEIILRRGSARAFGRAPIRFEELSAALRYAAGGIPGDFLPENRPVWNDLFLIVNAVEGIPPGAYLFDIPRGGLVLLREGGFRREAGRLGLEQPLAADAAVNVYFLCRLEEVFGRLGGRGYRAAQMEAGIMGGKLYLSAYAQRIAATGLTFYDDEVTSFFGAAAEGREVMFLVLLGRRNSPLLR